jgi:predicted transcriptional regulator
VSRTLTISIDDELAGEVERSASERSQPVEEFVADALRQAVIKRPDPKAMDRILETMRRGLPLGGKPLTREEIYDRGR